MPKNIHCHSLHNVCKIIYFSEERKEIGVGQIKENVLIIVLNVTVIN